MSSWKFITGENNDYKYVSVIQIVTMILKCIHKQRCALQQQCCIYLILLIHKSLYIQQYILIWHVSIMIIEVHMYKFLEWYPPPKIISTNQLLLLICLIQ